MSEEQNVSSTPKAEAVAERAAYRAERRAKRHSHWCCFWTWPWGHVWKIDDRAGLIFFLKCASCGKRHVDLPR